MKDIIVSCGGVRKRSGDSDHGDADAAYTPKPKRTRGVGKIFDKQVVEGSPEEWIQQQGFWHKKRRSCGLDGAKQFYSCKVKHCPVSCYILEPAENEDKVLFVADESHNHTHEVEKPVHGIPPATKSVINALYDDGIKKPKPLMEGLRRRNIQQLPTMIQLKNLLTKIREQKEKPSTVSLGDLAKWCKDREEISTDDDDKAFVIHDIDFEEMYFRIFITTKTLIRMTQLDVLAYHGDATYKLTWNGFPVLMIGITDHNHEFHSLGIGVCSNEETADFHFLFSSVRKASLDINGSSPIIKCLVSDATNAIYYGLVQSLSEEDESPTRIMCWAHVVRAIDKKLPMVNDKEKRIEIRKDIFALQLAVSPNEFRACKTLFLEKWNDDVDVKKFLSYFVETWLKPSTTNWYEGVAPGVSSHNKSLESTNHVLKREATVRERLPMANFFCNVEKWIQFHSRERSEGNLKKVALNPTVDLPLMTESWNWLAQGPRVMSEQEGDDLFYVKPNSASNEAFESSIDHVHSDNFDQFIHNRMSKWIVRTTHGSISCTCPMGIKKGNCKHIIGMRIHQGICEVPDEAKNVPLREMRKRGCERECVTYR